MLNVYRKKDIEKPLHSQEENQIMTFKNENENEKKNIETQRIETSICN